MANKHATLAALFTDIADAIREKTSDTASIIADDFPDVIRKRLQVMLIRFTIDGTTYQAEGGMTWAEWVESDYNVDRYKTGVLGQDFGTAGMFGFSSGTGDLNVIATASSNYSSSRIVGKYVMLQGANHSQPVSQSEVITSMDYMLGPCGD